RALGKGRGFRLLFQLERLLAALARPLLDSGLRDRPFPVQLRRRLEILGPTYIKLGQILALRRDLLPESITEELKNLLDRLPVVPFPRYLELIVADLKRPIDEMFSWIDPIPIGSASIAQTHRATTCEGDSVILKVVKPGIRETLTRDARLLKWLGSLLQVFLERYQPRQVIREFVDYTLREVDLRREADNAETFAANFKDEPDIRFPRIYRAYSGRGVLTMEFFQGIKPAGPEVQALAPADRDRLVDLGAAAIIRMLFRDGFFHADLHPGNLLILPGPQLGFIDLGMVGRFDGELRRLFMYYYFALVMGDAEGAARYLSAIARTGTNSNPVGFRREVTEILVRWHQNANFREFSLAQLVMYTTNLGAHYRMYFPVEMVLMVKALVTFEGVGQVMKPGLDIAAVSQEHINRIFLHQFSPLRIARESLRNAPDLFEAISSAPMLITEGLRLLEQARRPTENPLAGLRGTLFGGFCLVAGAILAGAGGPWYIWGTLFLVGILTALHRGRK
ncbi:MAG TPA: AarF/UbiB family protein, partial [Thermoanaerobaculia bacterium]|nr:AarF/UbiB family protein [Thermoanaerobaculia bacterium]